MGGIGGGRQSRLVNASELKVLQLDAKAMRLVFYYSEGTRVLMNTRAMSHST